MIVPTRVVAGDMGAIGLSVAVGLELLATVGPDPCSPRACTNARFCASALRFACAACSAMGRKDASRRRASPRRIAALRSGVAVLLAGAALVLIDGAGIVEIGLVVVGVVLVGLHGWGRRTAPRR